jgi:hypothetical protein
MTFIPYAFTARMTDGRTLCEGDLPVMIWADATNREIEQTILERAEQEGDVIGLSWHVLSDWAM